MSPPAHQARRPEPPGREAGSTPAWLDVVLIVLFVAFVTVPAVLFAKTYDDEHGALLERRMAADRPEWSWAPADLATWPERFEPYFADTFGMRTALLHAHGALKWFAFRATPTPSMVRGATGDWIFFTKQQSIEVYRGLLPMDAVEMEAWRRLLEERRDWLARRGMAYVYVIAPNKNQIYTEHMPARLTRVGPTRLDQFTAYMDSRSDFPLTDYRTLIRTEKANDRGGDYVYMPLGTHWSSRGAYVAYRDVVEQLRDQLGERFPGLRPHERDAYQVSLNPDDQGDSWAERMYLGDGRVTQESWEWRLAQGAAREVEARGGFLRSTTGNESLPKLVVFHDSFGPMLKTLLADSASESVWQGNLNFDTRLIEREQPDGVVQVCVERTLIRNSPAQPFILDQDDLAERFEASKRSVVRFDPAGGTPPLRPSGSTRIQSAAGGAVIQTSDPRGAFIVAGPNAPPPGPLVLALDVSTPRPGPIEVRFKTRRVPSYTAGQSETVRAPAGRSRVYLYFKTPDLLGPLLIKPGTKAGRYVIHALEARAIVDR